MCWSLRIRKNSNFRGTWTTNCVSKWYNRCLRRGHPNQVLRHLAEAYLELPQLLLVDCLALLVQLLVPLVLLVLVLHPHLVGCLAPPPPQLRPGVYLDQLQHQRPAVPCLVRIQLPHRHLVHQHQHHRLVDLALAALLLRQRVALVPQHRRLPPPRSEVLPVLLLRRPPVPRKQKTNPEVPVADRLTNYPMILMELDNQNSVSTNSQYFVHTRIRFFWLAVDTFGQKRYDTSTVIVSSMHSQLLQ